MNFATDTELEYEQKTFRKVDAQKAIVKGKSFQGCSFINCSLAEIVFDGCKFHNCTFKTCDLSLMKVKNSVFADVKFDDTKVVGINWTEAMWGKNSLLGSLTFSECTLNYSTFIGLKMHKLVLVQCLAKDVDFSEADLTKANFEDTDLSESRFHHTNLTEANLAKARNYHIPATQNTLKKTRFSLPEAVSLLHSLDIILDE
ncbi:MAG: pentapeptide repeat-containing protein [Chloroflexi bacterium]|nr:pentapeptide repeat-containing protein [Chloroflexota bacterium]MCC6895843.1 pentapeptide repeat-containing protein [Anaerolineae bacterium]